MDQPFVSIVTPFYNTEAYIADCIEAVLGQTHTSFEYLLVNNCSTDRSREIAARYAARDRRIRLLDNREFLDQTRNFNGALEQISLESCYVKVALADDLLFPECVARMVALAEREPSVGIVSAYRLWGDYIDQARVPIHVSRMPGREACRRMLVDRVPLCGSQNTVLYRADLVRKRRPFFAPDRYFADSDTAIELLLKSDFGFVHQVLSFTRTDNDSLWQSSSSWKPLLLNAVLALDMFGAEVLPDDELAQARAKARREYLLALGKLALRNPGRKFWEYHRKGLAVIGWDLRWFDVLPWSLLEVLHVVANPENTLRRALSRWRRRAPTALAARPSAARRMGEIGRKLRILAAPGFAEARSNPYQKLLYDEMVSAGHLIDDFPKGPFNPFSLGLYDVIHLHWHDVFLGCHRTKSSLALVLLSNLAFFIRQKLGGARVVWTIHDASSLQEVHRVVASLYRIFLRMTVDAFIALSESSVKQAVVLNPWLQGLPYRVIPHGHYRGHYPDTLREDARRQLGLRTDEKVILWFGKIKKYKGLPDLIAAFREVRLPNVRLLVVGANDGAMTEEMLRVMKADPRILSQIRFIEEEETAVFFKSSDLCVLPYKKIFNSGTTILALSFSVPALVTESPATVDLNSAVGADWVSTFRGPITAKVIEEAVEHFGRFSSSRTAPLDKFEWSPISSKTADFFLELASRKV
jgi:glycosyltransferase involved in cell wall biosynthesis